MSLNNEQSNHNWLGIDIVPLGPNFVWAVRAKSSTPKDVEQPWFVVKHGIARSESYGRCRGEECIESIMNRMSDALNELCTTGTNREFRRHYSDNGDPCVGFWRFDENQEAKTMGHISVGKVEVFYGKNMNAWEFSRAASSVLLNRPLY